MLGRTDVQDLLQSTMWPAFQAERERLDRIDKWWRWDPERPYTPRHATGEYKQLAGQAFARWLARVVNAVVQQLYVEGYAEARAADNATPWRVWQANGMDARQIPLHRAAVGYGLAYTTVTPGEHPLTGEVMPVIRGVSPRQMIAFWLDEGEDEFPAYALRAEPTRVHGQSAGWKVRVYDDEVVHRLLVDASGKPEYVQEEAHGVGVCPVVRYNNVIDLEGRVEGEVEPNIPVAARIQQTAFDRGVVQRYASWKVRTVTGMAQPDPIEGESEEQAKERTKRQLRVDDILAGEEGVTFGTLDETPLGGFIEAHDADVRTLAAVSQTPVHELLGNLSNLSAEALVAAESSLNRKVEERKHTFGESHELTLRLAAHESGDVSAATDVAAQVRWKDMESRSLAQAADALGKMATMLGVPVELLWEKIPGFTQQDVERATAKLAEGDSLARLERLLSEDESDLGDEGD